MKKDIDCLVFEDQLDALSQGTLPEDGAVQLRLHAGSCSACAAQLKVKEHLALPSLEELEAAVPEELLASLWPRIRPELGTHARKRIGSTWSLFRVPWLAPTMAAATVVLVLTTGLLFAQLRRVEAREQALSDRLSELAVRTEAVERTAALGGRNTTVRALLRRLSDRESVSVAWLEEFLQTLPEDTPLFNAAQVEAFRGNTSSWTPAIWRRALAAFGEGEGIRAGDLLRVLESVDVDPGTRVPTSRLIEILS